MELNADIITLFHELLELTPEDRGRYYAAGGIDAAVAAEVESLIRFDQNRSISIESIVRSAVCKFI
jgi:hypothetical protein